MIAASGGERNMKSGKEIDSLPFLYFLLGNISPRSFKISDVSIKHIKKFFSFNLWQSGNIFQAFEHRFTIWSSARAEKGLSAAVFIWWEGIADGIGFRME
jgi:hypothetical protein